MVHEDTHLIMVLVMKLEGFNGQLQLIFMKSGQVVSL